MNPIRLTVRFIGRVQNVGFRATTHSIARSHAVTGFVHNEHDGSVLCVAEGESAAVHAFIEAIKAEMGSLVRETQVTESPATGIYRAFTIEY